MRYKSELSSLLVAVGRNVKRLRLEKGLTQQDLAFECDMDKSTVSNIERFNLDNITIGTLVKMCLILECNLIELFKIL